MKINKNEKNEKDYSINISTGVCYDRIVKIMKETDRVCGLSFFYAMEWVFRLIWGS